MRKRWLWWPMCFRECLPCFDQYGDNSWFTKCTPDYLTVVIEGVVKCDPDGFTPGTPTATPHELNGTYVLERSETPTGEIDCYDYVIVQDGNTVKAYSAAIEGYGTSLLATRANGNAAAFIDPDDLPVEEGPVEVVANNGNTCAGANGSQSGTFTVTQDCLTPLPP